MTIFIGTSGWVYKHWKGSYYPLELPQKDWFSYYASHFIAVEINATFYRAFPEHTYLKWSSQVEPGFRYALKVPRWITHEKLLNGIESDLEAFWQSACLLQDHLGMILLQLAPDAPFEPDLLRKALAVINDPTRVAVEVRSPDWDKDETREILSEFSAAWVNVDAPGHPLTGYLTGRRAYLRLHGRLGWYASDYTHEELTQIADTARRIGDQGAQEIYIFFNNDLGGYAPRNAMALKLMLP